MSNYNIYSILNSNAYSYDYTNSKASTNSSFSSAFESIANVPTGRKRSNIDSINSNNTTNNYLNTNYTIKLPINDVSSRDSKTEKAISIAKSHLGGKYVWGATGPDTFDCSGFTQYIYKKAYGINIPRVSYEQAKYGKSISKDELQPGDLVFFDTMNKGRVSHVGIYIGDNKFIHSANSRSGIIESELKGYYAKKYICSRRPIS